MVPSSFRLFETFLLESKGCWANVMVGSARRVMESSDIPLMLDSGRNLMRSTIRNWKGPEECALCWVRMERIRLVKEVAPITYGRWYWWCTTCLHGCARKRKYLLLAVFIQGLKHWYRHKLYGRSVPISLMVFHNNPLMLEPSYSWPFTTTRHCFSNQDRDGIYGVRGWNRIIFPGWILIEQNRGNPNFKKFARNIFE